MGAKSDWLQIRVSAAQKAQLRQYARRAGVDVSAYVLARALPEARTRLEHVFSALRDDSAQRHALAALSDIVTSLASDELVAAVADADVGKLSAFTQNYVAATIEYVCAKRGVTPPAWARDVAPLAEPWFATDLASLRTHLLIASPVAFKRRNLFVDAGPDARV